MVIIVEQIYQEWTYKKVIFFIYSRQNNIRREYRRKRRSLVVGEHFFILSLGKSLFESFNHLSQIEKSFCIYMVEKDLSSTFIDILPISASIFD